MPWKIVGGKVMTKREVLAYVRERLGKGVRSAGKFMVDRLRTVVGVQAPRVRTIAGGWRATTRATPGAPPRRVSGIGQKSINYRVTEKNVIFSAIWYMLYWENHGHPWMRKTIEKYSKEMMRIMTSTRKK